MNCPHCTQPDFTEHCRFCGCTAVINPVSKHVVFMIRGRVILAPADLRAQWAKHDETYAIEGPDPRDPKEL